MCGIYHFRVNQDDSLFERFSRTMSERVNPSAFLSHRWDLIIDLRDLPILFMYVVGVTISHTGINLFLAHSERVK